MLRLLVNLLFVAVVTVGGYQQLYWMKPGVQTGSSILLSGRITKNSPRLEIRLCSSLFNTLDCELIIDINKTLGEMKLLRSRGGLETSVRRYTIPKQKGNDFSIKIEITRTGFLIHMDDRSISYKVLGVLPANERYIDYGPYVTLKKIMIVNKPREVRQWHRITQSIHRSNEIVIKGRLRSNIKSVRLCKKAAFQNCDFVMEIIFSKASLTFLSMHHGILSSKKTYPNPIIRGSIISIRIEISNFGYLIEINEEHAYYHSQTVAASHKELYIYYGPDITVSEFAIMIVERTKYFCTKLKEPDWRGQVIVMKGYIPLHVIMVRFCICNSEYRRDCPLDIVLRYYRSDMTISSRKNFLVVNEELYKDIPLIRDHTFYLQINIHYYFYRIQMGENLFLLKNRAPRTNTEFICFNKEIVVNKIIA